MIWSKKREAELLRETEELEEKLRIANEELARLQKENDEQIRVIEKNTCRLAAFEEMLEDYNKPRFVELRERFKSCPDVLYGILKREIDYRVEQLYSENILDR